MDFNVAKNMYPKSVVYLTISRLVSAVAARCRAMSQRSPRNKVTVLAPE
jgi:hypothetical protein